MPFAGKVLQVREIAAAVADAGWTSLVKGTATFYAESHGYIGAWHDNINETGNVWSRDCGLPQISIAYSANPTQKMLEEEASLRTESKDPDVYKPILANSVLRAREMYLTPWRRNGQIDIRRWQAWAAYTSGWATFPEWWVWEHMVGPWVPTGRYIQGATVGVANYHLLIKKDMSFAEALERAESLASQFHIEGVLGKKTSKTYPKGFVQWLSHPPKPTEPPADGVGPRPKPNDGV